MILYCKDSLGCIDNNNIELINNMQYLAFCVMCCGPLYVFLSFFRLTDALSLLTRCSASKYPLWYCQTFDISKQTIAYNMVRKTLKIPKGNQDP